MHGPDAFAAINALLFSSTEFFFFFFLSRRMEAKEIPCITVKLVYNYKGTKSATDDELLLVSYLLPNQLRRLCPAQGQGKTLT